MLPPAFLPLCAVITLLYASFFGKRIWTIMLCQRLSPDMPLQLASDTILRMLRARVHHHRQGQVNIILFLFLGGFFILPIWETICFNFGLVQLTLWFKAYVMRPTSLISILPPSFVYFRLFTIYHVRPTSMHGWRDWRRDQGMCSWLMRVSVIPVELDSAPSYLWCTQMTQLSATGYVCLETWGVEFGGSSSFVMDSWRFHPFCATLILQCYRNQQGDSSSGRGRSSRKDVIFKQSWLVSR